MDSPPPSTVAAKEEEEEATAALKESACLLSLLFGQLGTLLEQEAQKTLSFHRPTAKHKGGTEGGRDGGQEAVSLAGGGKERQRASISCDKIETRSLTH